MPWDLIKNWYWLIGVVVVLVVAWFRISIFIQKSKERLEQVAENEKGIRALKTEITEMKDDISEIKNNQEKQGGDIAAILMGVQSMMASLAEKGCDIGPARDKLNEHLAKR